MAGDEGHRGLILNVLRLRRRPHREGAVCLLVVPAGIGSTGEIDAIDLRSPGEPVETWLANRRIKLGTAYLPSGR